MVFTAGVEMYANGPVQDTLTEPDTFEWTDGGYEAYVKDASELADLAEIDAASYTVGSYNNTLDPPISRFTSTGQLEAIPWLVYSRQRAARRMWYRSALVLLGLTRWSRRAVATVEAEYAPDGPRGTQAICELINCL